MRPRAIREIHFFSELASDIAMIGCIILAFMLVSRAVESVFAFEALQGAKTIDHYVGRFLEDQNASFESLSMVPDKVSGAFVLSAFVDVYQLDDSLSITSVYKRGEKSVLFKGLSFAGSRLGGYFKGVRSDSRIYSPVLRAPEDDLLSVYVAHRIPEGILVGRINLGLLSLDIGIMSSSVRSIYYLATNDGIVYATSDPEHRFSVLPEIPSGTRLPGGEYIFASVRSAVLGGRIAVLHSQSAGRNVMYWVMVSYAILFAGILAFSVMKFLVGYLFIGKPLGKFVRKVSSWSIQDGPDSVPGGFFVPEDIAILNAEFGKAKARVLQAYEAAEGVKSELAALNQSLEKRVEARTADLGAANAELGRKNAELATALDNLRKAGDILVAHEKMAALGELSAGVAHELNTPLGTVISSVSFAERIMPETYSGAGKLASSLDPEGVRLLADLYGAASASKDSLLRTSREVMKVMEDMCVSRGWKNPRMSGERMAELGLVPGDDLLERVLLYPSGEEAVSCAWNFGSVLRGLSIARNAAEKASRVVGALRSYSWDTGDIMEKINLKEDLETVMILFENRMKGGISLKMELDGCLDVMGNADRLDQVWINLVSNALHAIGGNGRLWIRARRREGAALVEIIDSGQGIPWDVRDRIFEPFFTTKPKGEGTGLGLDISRRIIQAMHGKLWFESVPGRTVFYTQLPLAPDSGEAKGD